MTQASDNIKTTEIKGLDPVTFEVLRSHFDFCSERMSKVLQKTAFSPILSDMLDYSHAVYDSDIRLVSQSPGCPIHMAAMHFAARASVAKYGKDNLKPGDVVILNDPFEGGTHIPDTTFTMPIYLEEELLGYAVSRGHWQDLGGGAAGGQSFGTHIAGEGLRIPPLKLFQNYKLNDDLLALIKNNTRCPEYIEGDIQAHMGALKVAEQEFIRGVERYGLDTVRTAMRELIAYTNRISRSRIAAIPDGEYTVSDFVDTDGFSDKPIRLNVKISISGESLTVDFSGSDPQCIGAINSGDESITVWGSGKPIRDFLYVDDAARSILFVIDKVDSESIINVSSGNPISIRELIEAIAETTGFEGSIEWDSSKPDGQEIRFLSSRLISNLGFKVEKTLAEALKDTVRWYNESFITKKN